MSELERLRYRLDAAYQALRMLGPEFRFPYDSTFVADTALADARAARVVWIDTNGGEHTFAVREVLDG